MAISKDFKIKFTIENDGSAALEKVGESAEKTEKSFSKLSASVVVFNQALELAQKAYQIVNEAVSTLLDAYAAQESAQTRLISSLKLTGSYSRQSVRAFNDLAAEIQRTTVVEDDLVLSLVAQGKAMGLTNEQTENAIKAAVDMSGALGIDVSNAFEQAAATANGFTGRLAKIAPELNSLDDAQLRAGKGIEILQKRFQGFGEAQAQTFAGVMQQTKNAMGDVLEELGTTLVEFFGLFDAAKGKVTFFSDLAEQIKTIRPAILQFRDDIVNFFNAVTAGFNSINLDERSKEFLKYAAVVGGALLILKSEALATVAALIAAEAQLIAAAFAMLAPLLPVILQVAAVAAAVVALDIVLANLNQIANILSFTVGKLGEYFSQLSIWIFEAGKSAAEFLGMDVSGFQKNIESATKKLTEQQKKNSEEWENITKQGMSFGVTGQVVKGVTDFFKGFNEELTRSANKTSEVKKVAEETANVRTIPGSFLDKDTLKKRLDNLDQIKKKNDELLAGIKKNFQTEKQQIQETLALQLKEVDMLEAKLKRENTLGPMGEKELQNQRELLKVAASLAEAGALPVGEIEKQTKAAQQAYREVGKTQEQIQQMNIDLERQKIDLALRNIDLTKEGSDAAVAGIQAQMAALDELDKAQKASLQGQRADKLVQSGPASNISQIADTGQNLIALGKESGSAFAEVAGTALGDLAGGLSGIMGGMVSGFIGAANAVLDAIGGLLDAIPNLLNKFADIVDKITDLPNKILKGVERVFESVLNLIKDLIPNIFKMVEGILEAAVSFIEKLPEQIANLIEKLPDMFISLIDKLPGLIQRVIEALINAAPRIAIALVKWFVQGMPRVAFALLKYMVIELPKAIFKGIVNGLKELVNMISDALGFGDVFDIPKEVTEFPEKISEGAKDLAKSFSRDASQLFAVKDLDESAKKFDVGDKIINAFRAGGTDFTKKGNKFIQMLKDAWKWIYKNFIEPIVNIGKATLKFIGELISNIVNTVFDILVASTDFLMRIGAIIWEGFKAVAIASWEWIKSIGIVIWTAFKSAAVAAWQWIKSIGMTIWNALVAMATATWDWIKSIGGAIWDGLVEIVVATWDFIVGLGAAIWNDGLIGALNHTWEYITRIGAAIWGAFQGAVSATWDFVLNIGRAIWGALQNAVVASWDFVLNIGRAIWGALQGAVNATWDFVLNIGRAIWAAMYNAIVASWDFIVSIGKAIWSGLSGAISSAWDWIKSIGAAIWDGWVGKVGTWFTKAGKAIWDGFLAPIGNFFSEAGKKIWNALKDGLDTVGNFFSGDRGSDGNGAVWYDPTSWFSSGGMVLKQAMKTLDAAYLAMGGNVLSPLYAASGMPVVPTVMEPRGTDTVPAMLTPGEFIVNRDSTSQNRQLLEDINRSRGPFMTDSGGPVILNVTINAKTFLDADQIRREVIPEIERSLLRSSQEGKRVLASTGVRSK